MRLNERWLQQVPARAPLAPLPAGMVVQGAADYVAPASPRLLLRWVARTSSGDGVRFEHGPFILSQGRQELGITP